MSITIKNLTFSYGRHEALKDISMQARPGRITALLGPNAAGKSTLLRCVIGTLKPTAGSALIDGMPSHRLRARQLAARLAYVPQRSIVSAAFSVREVIELGRYALTPDPQKVDDAIARLDLQDIANRPYPELSVGQQQRVVLARAFAQLSASGHLILDEPMAAMDLRHVRDAMSLLRELANNDVTVLIAMHDVGLAVSVANDVWLLDRGRMVTHGEIGEVLTTDLLATVFGVPFNWTDGAPGGPYLVADARPQQNQATARAP
ncbi:MAG: ABC transporter ATP-binding protein [Acidiferrobacterales bacterium]